MAKQYRSKSKFGYGFKAGFKLDYPPEFNEPFKKYIRTRDRYVCSICQARARLDVHHIDYNRYHTVKSNCISVCRECHKMIHGSSPKRRLEFQTKLGLLAMQRERQNASSR